MAARQSYANPLLEVNIWPIASWNSQTGGRPSVSPCAAIRVWRARQPMATRAGLISAEESGSKAIPAPPRSGRRTADEFPRSPVTRKAVGRLWRDQAPGRRADGVVLGLTPGQGIARHGSRRALRNSLCRAFVSVLFRPRHRIPMYSIFVRVMLIFCSYPAFFRFLYPFFPSRGFWFPGAPHHAGTRRRKRPAGARLGSLTRM